MDATFGIDFKCSRGKNLMKRIPSLLIGLLTADHVSTSLDTIGRPASDYGVTDETVGIRRRLRFGLLACRICFPPVREFCNRDEFVKHCFEKIHNLSRLALQWLIHVCCRQTQRRCVVSLFVIEKTFGRELSRSNK
jgi:hypothetical protein